MSRESYVHSPKRSASRFGQILYRFGSSVKFYFRLSRMTTLAMVQRLLLHSIFYPGRLSGLDSGVLHIVLWAPHISITENACHNRVTPNGRRGITAVHYVASCRAMKFLPMKRHSVMYRKNKVYGRKIKVGRQFY